MVVGEITKQSIIDEARADTALKTSVELVSAKWALSEIRVAILWDLVNIAYTAGISRGLGIALQETKEASA